MKKNFIYFISKLNNSIYEIFSPFPFYVAKSAIGFVYALLIHFILSFFGKNFIKTFVIFCILLFVFEKLNFLSLNVYEIKETIGFSAEEDYLKLTKNFFNSYYFEFLSFAFSFFVLRVFFK